MSLWEQGYVILRDFIDVSDARLEMQTLFDPSDTNPVQDFGSDGRGTFPCTPALNQVTVHPKLIAIVKHYLQTTDIRLTQSVAWAKYGQTATNNQSNNDQRIHMDWGNHYWAHPPKNWYAPEVIAAIVYYSDTRETGGGTAVVARQGPDDPVYQWPFTHMPGISKWPFVNNRIDAEKVMSGTAADIRQLCYKREEYPHFKPGDVLLYRLDTWHRGRPVNEGQVRHVHNLAWRRADAQGIQQWNRGFTQKMYYGHLEHFVSTLSAEQRETLGFPKTFDQQSVSARYPDWQPAIENPPPVPEYWHWSSVVLNATETASLTKKRFVDLCTTLHIDIRESGHWKWTLQWCHDMHYMNVECHVFTKDASGPIVIDINNVQGDRRLYWHTIGNMRALWHGGEMGPTRKIAVLTTTLSYNLLPSEEGFALLTSDMDTEKIIPYLKHSDKNIVRCAMKALSTSLYKPTKIVYQWSSRQCQTFLEEEIQKWANHIVYRSRL